MIKFGTGGNPESFYEQGGKSSLEMPAYLKKLGLNAYEYECGRGVRISMEAAEKLGKAAVEHGISLSLHAPYFTNISSTEQERIDKSINYIVESATAAKAMGATRVVVHMGNAKDITRRNAMDISKRTLARALKTLDELDLGCVTLCPETMGKLNQMGTLEEVIEVCQMDERLLPTIDFGHLYCRMQGALTSEEDYDAMLQKLEKKLGSYRSKNFHCHFSQIEFTRGGEKKHLTFAQDTWGPDFAPLASVLAKRKLTPVIICESAGTQAVDAMAMRDMYENCMK